MLAWVHFRLGDKPTTLGLAQKQIQRRGAFSCDAACFLVNILKASDFTAESLQLNHAYSKLSGRFLDFARANPTVPSVPAKAG